MLIGAKLILRLAVTGRPLGGNTAVSRPEAWTGRVHRKRWATTDGRGLRVSHDQGAVDPQLLREGLVGRVEVGRDVLSGVSGPDDGFMGGRAGPGSRFEAGAVGGGLLFRCIHAAADQTMLVFEGPPPHRLPVSHSARWRNAPPRGTVCTAASLSVRPQGRPPPSFSRKGPLESCVYSPACEAGLETHRLPLPTSAWALGTPLGLTSL